MSAADLPGRREVRARIELVEKEPYRRCLQFLYLCCGRVSEAVSEAAPSDHSPPRGPTGEDVYATIYERGDEEVEAAIFSVSTAKRGGMRRVAALPLDPRYEPWTSQLYDYFEDAGSRPVFPFTRQTAWHVAHEAFDGFRYPIEPYRITEDGEVVKDVKRHTRPFGTHALRHLRATELVEVYGFDGVDLSMFGGWTLQHTIGLGSLARYTHLEWRRYFPKLLRRRR
jgi:hypothetical protein